MTVLTPDLEQAILAAVEQGTPATQAAQALGIDRRTLLRWREIADTDADTWPSTGTPLAPDTKARIVSFAQALDRAEAACFSRLTASLMANATTPNEKTGWYDTQAADKLLSKHPRFRQDWHEDKHLTISGGTTVSHEYRAVEGMQSAEVLAAAGDDWADLATPPQLPALPAPVLPPSTDPAREG
jgi:transposase-like protein